MPDTPELQQAFGQPSGQATGCGFPVAHLMTLFHVGTGMLMRIATAPWRTHDLLQARLMHGGLAADDILLADRGFCSFGHLAMLRQTGIHAVFRAHQKQIVNFRKGRACQTGRERCPSGLPKSRWIRWLGRRDQVVEYHKPCIRPSWMSEEEREGLPATLLVRELRYDVLAPGSRTRSITLVTSLLNANAYPAADLAMLYAKRWEVETNLRHLKQTLGMDVLRTKSLDGIHKELAMFAIVYNLVRLVMLEAAQRRQIDADRISFVDALRWQRCAGRGGSLGPIRVVPERPGRHDPRVKKRRAKNYRLMTKPRSDLMQVLAAQALSP